MTVSNTTFSDNLAGEPGEDDNSDGGAISTSSEITITGSRFYRNRAQTGGAINSFRRELTISDSVFGENNAWAEGGALFSSGSASISGSEFSGNEAEESGGAILNWEEREISISDSRFSNNEATWGGAINNEGSADIDRSIFTSNVADWGGAIYNVRYETSLDGSYFYRNRARGGGGAYYGLKLSELKALNSSFGYNKAGENGGAVNASGRSRATLKHVTMVKNSAESGGGIYQGADATSELINSIIVFSDGGDCIADLSVNIGNLIGDASCEAAFTGDPKLRTRVNPLNGSPPYYPLRDDSKVIGAADPEHCPATDKIGTVRPQGDGCDIGAVEYVPEDAGE